MREIEGVDLDQRGAEGENGRNDGNSNLYILGDKNTIFNKNGKKKLKKIYNIQYIIMWEGEKQ